MTIVYLLNTSLQGNINIYLIVETRETYGYRNKKIELVHSIQALMNLNDTR